MRNDWDLEPVAEPRDVPEKLGWRTRDKHLIFVSANPDGLGGETTWKRAEEWVKRGISQWVCGHHVTDPDARSGSWLTPDEFEQAMNKKSANCDFQDIEDYKAVLAAMRSLESSGHEVRTVFWFGS